MEIMSKYGYFFPVRGHDGAFVHPSYYFLSIHLSPPHRIATLPDSIFQSSSLFTIGHQTIYVHSILLSNIILLPSCATELFVQTVASSLGKVSSNCFPTQAQGSKRTHFYTIPVHLGLFFSFSFLLCAEVRAPPFPHSCTFIHPSHTFVPSFSISFSANDKYISFVQTHSAPSYFTYTSILFFMYCTA